MYDIVIIIMIIRLTENLIEFQANIYIKGLFIEDFNDKFIDYPLAIAAIAIVGLAVPALSKVSYRY